jgi:hypothetical protein
MQADKSAAATTVVQGACPGMGNAWINFMPRKTATPYAAVGDVRAAHLKFVPGVENMHKKDQWCSAAVAKADEKTECTFQTASRGEYMAALYCETIEGWFFASAKMVNVTAKDNGGQPVSLSLTFKKAIDDVAQNSVVLNICGRLAESMAVPYNRVTDAYGGYFGFPSPTLPTASAAAKPAASTNKTASNTTTKTTTKTRMLNTTKNTTTPA